MQRVLDLDSTQVFRGLNVGELNVPDECCVERRDQEGEEETELAEGRRVAIHGKTGSARGKFASVCTSVRRHQQIF